MLVHSSMNIGNEWKIVNHHRRSKKKSESFSSDISFKKEGEDLYSSVRSSYREKPKPIMSYGIILFTVVEKNGKKIPLYLISQRRDTVEYVDFIRGQYSLGFLSKFFSLMSTAERERMKKYNFKELWNDLWINRNHRIFTDCFQKANQRFEQIKDQIPKLLEMTKSDIQEPQWGFPKGKKNAKEAPIACALREFSEETKLDVKQITIISTKQVVEIYKGSNDKLYGTNYYIARTTYPLPVKRIRTDGIRTSTVSEELGNLEWLTLEEVEQKLNPKRVKLLSYVHHIIENWYS